MDKAKKPLDDVSKRILESAGETERLKQELTALIAAGIRGSQPAVPVAYSSLEPASNKVQIVRSFDLKESSQLKKDPTNVVQVDAGVCPKKCKTYNVEEVKDYLKKQKAKRLADSKIKKFEGRAAADIRKEKLQELQRKAQEIVKKNVNKRARPTRSKSREPFSVTSSLDQSIIKPKSASLESLQNPNLLYPPEINHREGSAAVQNELLHTSFLQEVEPVKCIESLTVSPSNNQMPEWLKERPQGDPYNFINTVKRQLQYVENDRKPVCIDVGVQGDLDLCSASSNSHKQQDFNSFLSHKFPQRSKEHMNQQVNISHPKDGLAVPYSDHDSDTSKNIPSISSESVSIRKNLDPLRVERIMLQTVNSDRLNEVKRQLFKMPLKEKEVIPEDLGNIRLNRPELNLDQDTPHSLSLHYSKDISLHKSKPREVSSDLSDIKSYREKNPVSKSGITDIMFEGKDNSQRHSNLQTYSSDFLSPNQSDRRDSLVSFNRANRSPAYLENRSAIDDVEINSAGVIEKSMEEVPTTSFQELLTESDDSRKMLSVKVGNAIKQPPPSVERSSGSEDSLKTSITASKTVTSISILNQRILNDNPIGSISMRTLENHDSQGDNISSSSKSLSKSEASSKSSKSVPNLHKHKAKLTININRNPSSAHRERERAALKKNITLRSNKAESVNGAAKEIQLRFEAEIHLLTDVNQTINRLSDIERTYESMSNSNIWQTAMKKNMENKDTQTSQVAVPDLIQNQNYSALELTDLTGRTWHPSNESALSDATLASSHNLEEGSVLEVASSALSSQSRGAGSMQAIIFGTAQMMSLKMFDRLIKYEDDRIENWKKQLKIREQSLLNRTKKELIYLEMQKKQLIETGKLAEASLIKKKQRGILLKHQEERQEMRRLKQMQKEESQKRKAALKKDRNEIKKQLVSDKVLSSCKLDSRKKKTFSGPLKAIQSSIYSTVNSDASLTQRSANEEVTTISSRTPSRKHSLTHILPDHEENVYLDLDEVMDSFKAEGQINSTSVLMAKETLLMRERALAKRRKAAEELLQWHKKLLVEEKAIEELETCIGTIIGRTPSSPNKSVVSEAASMSQGLATETNLSQYDAASSPNYTADFDNESVHQKNSEDQEGVSSISSLIEGFSKIQDNILNLSSVQQSREDNIGEVVSETEVTESGYEEQKTPEEESVISVEEPSSPDKTNEANEEIFKEENSGHDHSVVTHTSDNSDSETEEQVNTVEELNGSVEFDATEKSLSLPEAVSPSKASTSKTLNESSEVNITEDSISTEDHVPETTQDVILASSSLSSPPSSNSENELIPQTSFKNKTDEEKAASLSARASTSPTKVLSIKGRFSIASSAVGILNERPFPTIPPETFDEALKSPPSPSQAKSPSEEDLDKSSRLQSAESDSLIEEKKSLSLGTEAEELHRKQLAIEQEIKLLKEQQQKDVGSPFYVREIPNKPPPPYTPPFKAKSPKTHLSVIPETREEVEQIIEYSAKIIHKAHLSKNLDHITISDNTLNLIAKDIDKSCYKYVFDLCKEIAKDHYNQFNELAEPSWLKPERKPVLTPVKPLDLNGLKRLMTKKSLELLGFERNERRRENAVIKWARKKRDHVDEVLVQEMQAEDPSWTNYDRDEALVKDRLCNEFLDMLMKESIIVLKKTVESKLKGGVRTSKSTQNIN
ncbi:uro-adherence factor A-like [Euwallacea similis]|uniref:uro-adherence factor A-like n=1 Tax=Euwallacea similis TaxID=1736056 RepID=UPI00345084B6